jgi:ADP-ribose pyrophosphatase YjhB (NUDIX family)
MDSYQEINFCVSCATALTLDQRAGKERPVCPHCGWVYFSDPKVAVAVLIQNIDQVLLVQRMMQPERGKWTLPGGFLDAGEDPIQAAARECYEETGLRIVIHELLDLISGQEHPRGAHLVLVYRGTVIGGELRAGDDAGQVAFFKLQNLPPLAFTVTKQILGLL